MQKCQYCRAEIMAPPEVYENESFKQKQKVEKVNAIVNNILQNSDFANVNVIDLKNSTPNDINANIKGIYSEVKAGRENNAVQVFKQSYHVGGNEAEQVIGAMKQGKGFDLSGFNLDINQLVREQEKKNRRNNLIIAVIVFLCFLIFAVGTLAIILFAS